MINYTNDKGESGYATKDLVVPHPTKPGLWKMLELVTICVAGSICSDPIALISVGRMDDQIVLLNGEKTNPVPIGMAHFLHIVILNRALNISFAEDDIVKCPLVKSAVMFGREQNQTGLLIELNDGQFNNLEHIIDQIWYVEHDVQTRIGINLT